MNIDELKIILDTINTTTGLAKDMGTTWIWLHYGFKVLEGLAKMGSLLATSTQSIFTQTK
jgi:hypothetical protein